MEANDVPQALVWCYGGEPQFLALFSAIYAQAEIARRDPN